MIMQAKTLPSNITILFDGSCTKQTRDLPKIATYGYIIKDTKTGEILSKVGGVIVSKGQAATNNVAEWAGLLNAIKQLGEWRGNLLIYGDSQLVINQLKGKYKCNKKHLLYYLRECRELLKFHTWTAIWIPRNCNSDCDRLSKFCGE